jgi:hypothetical protein
VVCLEQGTSLFMNRMQHGRETPENLRAGVSRESEMSLYLFPGLNAVGHRTRPI